MATGSFQVFDVSNSPTGSIDPVVLTQVLDVGVPLTFIGSVGSFTKGVNYNELVSGGVVITHNLNKFIQSVIVWLDGSEPVYPDRVTNIDPNNIFIDLSSFSTPSNTFIIILA